MPGTPNLILGRYPLETLGYRAAEFFITGVAQSYTPAGELGPDGHWNVSPSGEAEYRTRIAVLTPIDAAAFNGTVIVEWLNVRGGIDAPAVWLMAHREIARAGYAYVAVSAQRTGVTGGPSLGIDMSLKTLDPQRYSELYHPGDSFAFDIYSQVGRLLKENPGAVLGPLNPDLVLAVGESQSAMYLTTYVNAVGPLVDVYGGYLVHSRFGPAAPLDGSIFTTALADTIVTPRFRSDSPVPLIVVITETDLIGGFRPGYCSARQPDSDTIRAWEIPGAAHADNYTVNVGFIDNGAAAPADLAAAYAPTDRLMGHQLSYCINFAPQHHYVLQAAVAGLERWARTGEPAATAGPITLSHDHPPALVPDAHGLAQGGVRTPWTDVPVARTSGIGTTESTLSPLFGTGEVFDGATLARLYPGGVTDYLERFTAALDRSIAGGFLLAADRSEIVELAKACFPLTAPWTANGPGKVV